MMQLSYHFLSLPDTGKNEELKMKNKTASQSNKTYDTVHTGDDEKIM